MKEHKCPVIGLTLMWVLVAIICGLQTVNCKDEPTTAVAMEVEAEIETEAETTTAYEHWTQPHTEYIYIAEPETVGFLGYDLPLSLDIQKRVATVSEKYQVAEILIYAMIRTESNFKFVMGDNGNSVGYMQIQPRWWTKLANDNGLNIYDPGDNIELGVLILTTLMSKYNGNLTCALKAYNGGKPNGGNDWYVERIYKHMNELESAIYGR